jgi:hypothetical protein
VHKLIGSRSQNRALGFSIQATIQRIPYCDEATQKEVDDLFKKCLDVNDSRVRLVHGRWEDEGAEHVSRTSMKPKWHFASVDEITRQTENAKVCMNRVAKLIDGQAYDWSRKTRELMQGL